MHDIVVQAENPLLHSVWPQLNCNDVAMQAENPKQQYLLLKALNEVITSLGLPPANTQLPATQQDQVQFSLPASMHAVVLQLVKVFVQ